MVVDLGKPSPKQIEALKDTHKHLMYGGARGGGKSWFIRAKAVILGFKYPGIRMCIVRKTYVELTENHIKPLKSLLHDVCKYNDSRKELTFPNGSVILFKYCASENDVDNFQGLEFDVVFIDEATQLSEGQIKAIVACVRGVNNFPKKVIYTCNPGGKSHGYFRRLFVDRHFESNEYPDDYQFIQALVTDNLALMEMDKNYIRNLESLPRVLKEAWLNGRWDVFEGAYFEEFRATPDYAMCQEHGISVEEALEQHRWTHVIKPFEIPKDWKIFHSYDWGYGKPFSMCWWAVDYDGCLYQILQLYGCTGTPNEGVKWSNEEQFKEMHRVETEHRWLRGKQIIGPADPSIWDGSHGISAAETAEKNQVFFEPGVNDRVPGWMQLRERMKFDENGKAMIYFFDTCKDSIRTIPLMMFDEHKIEDLNTDLEDHIADAVRYMCMYRPIPPRKVEVKYQPQMNPLESNKQYKEKMKVRSVYG